MTKRQRPSALYLSHGGGPLPLLGDASHAEMVHQLQSIAQDIPRPSAILVISAHWEEVRPTITGHPHPDLLYDYSGFPLEAYQITYPAPGELSLSRKVFDCLSSAGMQPTSDNSRGFDHGLFVPLKIMYPEADIPCVQLSLMQNLSPELHIQLGEALARIDHEGLLVIGSGFSFHNMRAFFQPDNSNASDKNIAFESWLITTCTSQDISETDRRERLIDWEKAPHARFCHPREEHLLPLHVCYGLHGCASQHFRELTILGKKSSIYLW